MHKILSPDNKCIRNYLGIVLLGLPSSSCANWLAFQFCVFSAVEVRMKYCFFKRNEELLKNSISFWCNAFLSTSYYVEGLFRRFSQFFHAHSFYKKNANISVYFTKKQAMSSYKHSIMSTEFDENLSQ